MARYHVLMSDELMSMPDLMWPEGFRPVEPSGPGPDGHGRWWLVEDDDAGAELEQHRVEPVFMRLNDERPVVAERHVVNERGWRVHSG